MVGKNTLTGKVEKSEINLPGHFCRLTTIVHVSPEKGQRVPYAPFNSFKSTIPFSIRGRHFLIGQRVNLEYEYHTGVLWAQNYSILSEEGEPLHRDSACKDY
jgi:hypothetical protein